MERAPERADIALISIRPCWVQDVASYERNLGPIVRDPSVLIGNYCSYVDVYDLCEATVLAVESDLPGHEVFYVASPDTIGGHPLEEIVRAYHGATEVELRPLDSAPDASAIDCSKARRLLGWEPKRSWRDYLDDDGRLKGSDARGDAQARPRRAGDQSTSASVRGRWRAASGSAGDRSTTTSRSRRSAARWRPASTGSTPPPIVRLRPLRGGRRPGARAVPARRGRARLHEVRPAGRAPAARSASTCGPESIRSECEASLRRLGVERIDLYQFHWPDYATGTPVEESWGTMVELVDEGKVRWLGRLQLRRRASGARARRSATSTRSSRRSRCSTATRDGADPVGA